MKKMMKLNLDDINNQFIIIDTLRKNNIISQYCGIDGYGENSHLTHKFCHSYITKFRIYHTYYPIQCQKYYILIAINLPFDIASIINQYLYIL